MSRMNGIAFDVASIATKHETFLSMLMSSEMEDITSLRRHVEHDRWGEIKEFLLRVRENAQSSLNPKEKELTGNLLKDVEALLKRANWLPPT